MHLFEMQVLVAMRHEQLRALRASTGARRRERPERDVVAARAAVHPLVVGGTDLPGACHVAL